MLALLALASAVAWAALVARDMAGEPPSFGVLTEVLGDTAFGAVYSARLALLAGLVVLTIFPSPRWRAPLLAAGAATASLARVGHAAMQTGALGFAHRLNGALHLLCVAFWLGGLLPFLACLRILARAPERREALIAMMRFSRRGHLAVPGLFLTGILNIAMTTQRLPWPLLSPYRVGWAAKVGVFAAMTGLALLNRYVFSPQAGRRAHAARTLAAGTLAEFALALVALALVSGFATHDPA